MYYLSLSLSVQLGVEDVGMELRKVPSLPLTEFLSLMKTGNYTVIDTRNVSG